MGASKDVGEVKARLQAHTKMLNALRETQLEQGSQLRRVEGRLDRMEGRLDGVEGRLGRVEGRLDRVAGKLDRLETEMRNGFATMAGGMARIVELIESREP